MQVIADKGSAPIKAWVDGVEFEEGAKAQLKNIAAMPFIYRHVAVMPDVHAGIGATVGSVIATRGAIIPAAVGVDIGCGMMAVKTSIKAEQLPDNLSDIRSAIEAAIPHGRTDNGGRNDRGAWGDTPDVVLAAWAEMEPAFRTIVEKNGKVSHKRPHNQLCSLGGGNHFVELCIDKADSVWLMLHSGSRGVGNTIGSYFIDMAKREMERWFIKLPDMNLAYLAEGSQHFNDYVEAVSWAQNYAKVNRELMMTAAITALRRTKLLPSFTTDEMVVNCHHNYIAKENHFHDNVWITRKGAVRARKNDIGIIPGSMGARSFIVRGKGEPESFASCSHGAGRRMSRTQAKNTFSVEDHKKATEGVECRKDADVIDETPGAYKPIQNVMDAQSDLVEVLYELKQVICVKG